VSTVAQSIGCILCAVLTGACGSTQSGGIADGGGHADVAHRDAATHVPDAAQVADAGAPHDAAARVDAGALPAVCSQAVAGIQWTDSGVDCLGAAPTGWAAGLGASWQSVFERQCAAAAGSANCASESTAYYDCLAKMGGSCTPCVTPNSGECKGSGGIVYSGSCGNLESAFAQCACKPAGSACVTDVDCCAPSTLALTCLSGTCAY